MKKLLFALSLLAAIWLLIDYNNRTTFKQCLKASEYTDADICDCLERNGMKDENLCNN